MIIRSVKLTNFGIYDGEHKFDLSLMPTERFNRPIIFVRGKNGVGKSTLVTAIRLCLHGSLALDSRMAQQEYDDYLRRLIHRAPHAQEQPSSSSIELELASVQLGKQTTLRIQRQWHLVANRVVKNLTIIGDSEPFAEFGLEQSEAYLRELISPGLLSLFFFDGEKIQTLAENSDHSHQLLSDSVRSLLGLDTAEQLGKDLDIYISRQRGYSQIEGLQQELEKLVKDLEALENQLFESTKHIQQVETRLSEVRGQIKTQEQRVLLAGGKYAEEREHRLAEKQRLEAEVEMLKRQVMELCGGLFPFAIAPKLLKAVALRLGNEFQSQQELSARHTIDQRLSLLENQLLAQEDLWSLFLPNSMSASRQEVAAKLAEEVRTVLTFSSAGEQVILFDLSEKERLTQLEWIEQSLESVPQRFNDTIRLLSQSEAKLGSVTALLAQTPTAESIQPLFEELNQLHRQLGSLEQEQRELAQRRQQIEYTKEQTTYRQIRVREQIEAQSKEASRIFLATRAQKVLEAFRKQVTARKVEQIAILLVNRFNQLCRKKNFLERVEINPESFEITLYRMGKKFSRQQLSAGENQLFAIAILWSLREISGRPLPVIIDTPLSRLDSEHRISMMQEFFPFVSQQVMILGTDIELDDGLYEYLQPAISHKYEMSYDPDQGTTSVKHIIPQPTIENSIVAEQLALL